MRRIVMLNEVKHPAGEWNVLVALTGCVVSGAQILRFAQDDMARAVCGVQEDPSREPQS